MRFVFLPALTVGNAFCTLSLENNTCGECTGFDTKVGAPVCRFQVTNGGMRAPAAPRRELIATGAFLFRAVEIMIAGNSGLLGRGDEGFGKLMGLTDVRYPERAGCAVKGTRSALIAFGFYKIGQDVVPAPTAVPAPLPLIVVAWLAAYVDQAVDCTRAPEHLAARPVDLSIVHAWIGLGIEAPVVLRVEHGLGVADRDMDPGVRVRRSGLQQQHAVPSIRAQAIGQHAAGGARTYNHIIKTREHQSGVFFYLCGTTHAKRLDPTGYSRLNPFSRMYRPKSARSGRE